MKREVLVDGRWLEPPEPMERVLMALGFLSSDACVRFLIHREPQPLYAILDERGYQHETHQIEDGCYEVLIWSR